MTEGPPAGNHSLGEMLRAARGARGLDLTEVSRQTTVRRDYLLALEEGRTGDLPEPVYVRNFVKLYAQAVGLDARAALEMYATELRVEQATEDSEQQAADQPRGRRRAAAATVAAPGAAAAAPRRPARESGRRAPGSGAGAMTWLPSLLLIVVVVGLAVWGFNSTLFRPGTPGAPADPAPEPAAVAETTTEADADTLGASETVHLSVSTEPPGARVLVDAFPLEGLTPLVDAPVTARESRLIRVELEGYEPFEAPFDLTFNRNLSFVLQEAEEPQPADTATTDTPVATDAQGTITVTVSDESWLEIYPGTAREGNPHVYTTAGAGDNYTFDLPVYIRVGNAAGVSVSVSGRDLGTLGSAGEITARAFTLDD